MVSLDNINEGNEYLIEVIEKGVVEANRWKKEDIPEKIIQKRFGFIIYDSKKDSQLLTVVESIIFLLSLNLIEDERKEIETIDIDEELEINLINNLFNCNLGLIDYGVTLN